ncbi:UNVERIFIED_CONTAM: hypothetical protein HDU68_007521 [Siphonaria sp. JEL0065]|nr:hypothetical protein HDU68_007521 [Siphonaria sp. JEL0065]
MSSTSNDATASSEFEALFGASLGDQGPDDTDRLQQLPPVPTNFNFDTFDFATLEGIQGIEGIEGIGSIGGIGMDSFDPMLSSSATSVEGLQAFLDGIGFASNQGMNTNAAPNPNPNNFGFDFMSFGTETGSGANNPLTQSSSMFGSSFDLGYLNYLDSTAANESTMHSELDSLLQEISQASTFDHSVNHEFGGTTPPTTTTTAKKRAGRTGTNPAPVVAMMAPMPMPMMVPSSTNANVNSNPNPNTKKVGGGRKKRMSINIKNKSSDIPVIGDEPDDVGAADLTDSETVVFSSAQNPTEVFSQAAIKASTRRRTVEEPISCNVCSTPIGVLELRGTPASFEAAYAVNIRCGNCCVEPLDTPRRNSVGGSSSSATNLKKRRGAPSSDSPSDEFLCCQVCKRTTAQGCVKMRAIASPIHKPLDSMSPTLPSASASSSSSHQLQQEQEQEPTWVTPDFSINLICSSCHSKYLFCSECGGGGKQRTGKYRPRTLFPANRRTCSLPHIRIGTTEVLHRVLEAPLLPDSQNDVLEGVRDVFFDCLVSLYAVPGVLEGVDEDAVGFGGSTLSRIHADVERLWTSTVRDAIVSDAPRGLGGGKIYVTVAWIEKRNRNKGKYGSKKKKEGAEEERIPWLLRLAMEGTVAPLKEGASGASSSASLPALAAVTPSLPVTIKTEPAIPFGEEKTYVSFAVSEWDRPRGALFVLQMAPRSVYLPTMESYGDLLRRNIERVQADIRRDNAPQLEHIWCWTRDVSHSRLRSIPERLGFVPLEQYIREHPGVDRATFEREAYQPLQEEGVSVHVTTVKKFMQLILKKSK